MPAAASPLKERITEDMKAAMRAKDSARLGTIRLILSAIKQVEVDTRKDLSDEDILAILDKMAKQRRESIEQYDKAGRDDLAGKERAELEIIQSYLPEQLSEAEIDALIDAAISETGASGMKDMGKVMGLLKPKMQGRADMGAVSARVKARLS
ncbi:MAG: GatB/YqeY domain-containing protein [Gammaproteobacteria bacterium]|nr:MAG: GatB/YqeY domain-containing protein [Gammaproteobacteria bacterium]